MTALDLLNELAEARAAVEVARMDMEARRREILAPVQQDLSDLEAEYGGMLAAGSDRIADLEARVRGAVLQVGKSVKSEALHAVVSKGRVSWDTKALDGYAVAHPEILQFRSEGLPSVSIRTSK
jgi:hypothetical protein